MQRMHVVLGGYGRVGRYLAKMLEYEGHSVSVIDHTPFAFEESDMLGAQIVGEVFDRDALEQAGIREADVFAAVTSGDNSNVVSARIAKEFYRVPRVIARIYDPRRAEIYREMGVPTVASVTWASNRLLSLISHPEVHSEYQFGNGEIEMVEFTAPVDLVGRHLDEFEVPDEIHVAVIVRSGSAVLPGPGLVFMKDDRVYATVVRESVGKLERLLGMKE
jgi:trk system potassium uptake protein